MIHDFNSRVKSATTGFCRKEHSKSFHGAVDKFFKNDRELKKALKSVEKHLDIEAMIKLGQRVRALERLVLSKDDERFKQ